MAPDVVAIDISLLKLKTNMLYAFSMPCAVGLPIYGEISTSDGGQFYTDDSFCPGNSIQTVIVKCWLARIPLIPVGMPSISMSRRDTGKKNKPAPDNEMLHGYLTTAYQALDERLQNVTDLNSGMKIVQDISSDLSKAIRGRVSRAQIDEARYIASRLTETVSFVRSLHEGAKLLAIIDLNHYSDTQYFMDLLLKGLTGEIYMPPFSDSPAPALVMIGKYDQKLADQVAERPQNTTRTQRLFSQELEKFSLARCNEELTEGEIDGIVADIVGRTRTHPEVARGVSPRGAIALREVLQGFGEIQGGLTRSSMERAALATLPPRITTRQTGDNPVNIVSDIVKEVLYGIRFSPGQDGIISPANKSQPSPEDILKALENLSPEQLKDATGQRPQEKTAGMPLDDDGQQPSVYVTSSGLSPDGMKKQSVSSKRTITQLMEELEQKFKRGEMSETEYRREKSNLEEMLSAASQLEPNMSDKELAETVMEMMDAKDKQWGKEVTQEQMFIYYHIKATQEEKQVSTAKQSWHGLRVVLDYLENRGISKVSGPQRSLSLTANALNTLLDYVTTKSRQGKEIRSVMGSRKLQFSQRDDDVRRYCAGDVFRDISIRRTLREIAKRKKSLREVDRRDLRVFIKRPRKVQSDIVLCVDSSGSMGFHHKLVYARLAAAGLARAAVHNGDRVGLVTFDDFGRSTMPLTDKRDDLLNYIANINAGGNTNIGDGIRHASELLLRDRSQNRKYIVLITDAQPTALTHEAFETFKPTKEKDLTEEYTILETRRASASRIETSVIHVANDTEPSEAFARNIARAGSGQVRRVGCLEDLKTLMR